MNASTCIHRGYAKLLIGATLAGCLVVATTARAQWSENFDSYTAGATVGGHGGWQGWNGANIAGTVSTAQAGSLPNSLSVIAGNDTVHPFTGYVGGQWSLRLQQYIPSTGSGETWTILMNQYPNSLNWSVQLLADISGGVIGVFDAGGTQQGSSLALVKDRWVDVRFDMNFDGNVSAYYNNSLLGTFAWKNATGSINQLQALDLYPDEGTGTAQVGQVFYDNLSLAQVPEPTFAALLGVAGLAFAVWRRRSPQS